MKKRIASAVLALCLLLPMLPTAALAATIIDNGQCGSNGSNVTWALDDDGVLTINGTGNMKDYDIARDNPWYDKRTSIHSVIITDGVTNIGNFAFSQCMELSNVTIPNSVTSIGTGAFYGCSGLSNVIIPNSVTTIRDTVFVECCSLTNVDIPNSVTSIGFGTFSGCSQLTSVNIPNSVTSIGGFAFSGCSQLTSVNIPNSVTSIGERTFVDCRGLTSVNIPDSVTSIGRYAFSGCRGLTSVNIPDSVTSIGEHAFSGCNSLTGNIYIPAGVSSIGAGAFSGTKISSIQVSGTNLHYASQDGVLFTEDETTLVAYPGGKSGVYYSIPNSVTSVNESAFSECSELISIDIPDSVTSIGEGAFSGCSGLIDVTIPNSVTTINRFVFLLCSGLMCIYIPDSVIYIESAAFYKCDKLENVYYSGSRDEWDKVSVISSGNDDLENAKIYYDWDVPPVKSFTITFEVLGGTVVDNQTVNQGDKVILPNPAPALAGHTFDGWYKESTLESKWDFDVDVVTCDMILYAKWTEIASTGPFTITFDPNEGRFMDPRPHAPYSTDVSGKLTDWPDSPVSIVQGLKFKGWFDAKEGGNKYDIDSIFSENVTLYAQWESCYDHDWNEWELFSTIPAGCEVPGRKVSVRNCKLCGLKDENEESIEATGHEFGDEQTNPYITKSATCKETGIREYRTYCTNDGCVEYKARTEVIPVSDDHQWGKWNTVKEPTATEVGLEQIVCDICKKVEERAIAVTHTCEPDLENKDLIESKEPTCAEDGYDQYVVPCKEPICDQNFPLKVVRPATGHDYSWIVTKDATSTTDGERVGVCRTCNDKKTEKISATEKVYKVTIELNDGASGSSGSSNLTLVVNANGTVEKLADPVWDGYTFIGWYADASYTTRWDFSTHIVNSNTTIYAKWAENSSGTGTEAKPQLGNTIVTVQLNGGTLGSGGSGSSDLTLIVDTDGKIEKPAENPTRDGYIFLGWYIDADYTEIWDFSTHTVNSNTTIYAKWEKDNGGTGTDPNIIVSIQLNGGTLGSNGSGSSTTTLIVKADGTVEKPADPVRDGYIFLGWYIDADYAEIWDFSTHTVNSNTTIYAKWEKDNEGTGTNPNIIVSIQLNGGTLGSNGSGSSTTTLIVKADGTVEKPADPVRDGYIFLGWYVDASCTKIWDFSTHIVNSNTTIYAGWKKDNSSVSTTRYYVEISNNVSGGSVSVSHSSAAEGTRVTIELYPRSGYELDWLSVIDLDTGRELSLTRRYEDEYTFIMPDGPVEVEVSFTSRYSSGGSWYVVEQPPASTKPVRWYFKDGQIWHVTDGLVSSNTLLTRDMLISILYNMDPSSSDEPIFWASRNNIVPDPWSSGLQGVDKNITREQTAMILHCYSKHMNYDLSPSATLAGCSDYNQVRPIARAAMSWTQATGLITSNPSNQLAPRSTVTCGEANAILSRFLSTVVKAR